jgi:biotin transport system substrate-specific component
LSEVNQQISKTFDLIMLALMIALMAISAFIKIPIGQVPITLQTLVVILSGIILGPRKGWLVPLIYLVMGLMGFPFFSNGGGLHYIIYPTFGFLLGFIPATFIAGLIYKIKFLTSEYFRVTCGAILGMAVIYLFGLSYIPLAAFFSGSKLAVWAMIIPILPLMIIGDVIKIIFLTAIVPTIKREYEHIRETL